MLLVTNLEVTEYHQVDRGRVLVVYKYMLRSWQSMRGPCQVDRPHTYSVLNNFPICSNSLRGKNISIHLKLMFVLISDKLLSLALIDFFFNSNRQLSVRWKWYYLIKGMLHGGPWFRGYLPCIIKTSVIHNNIHQNY